MTNIEKQPIYYSWAKVILWAFLFYMVWNFRTMVLVYNEGLLPGPDDFLRLHQAQNFLGGQSWFDLTAYRIFPPAGADIHWTRFVDLPIAGLIYIFNLMTDLTSASRLAAIAWPLFLFLLTVSAMVMICDRLAGKEHRLLALFFFVLSINTLAEFRPGRLDHHNVQILLLVLILLGVTRGLGKFSNYLVGGFIVTSIVTGLDSLLIIVAILGFLALEWAFQKQGSANRLLQTGLAMSVSSLVFYVTSFPVDRWFTNNACDAFSLFYLNALLLLSATFVVLALISHKQFLTGKYATISRLAVGGILALAITISLFYFFPHCIDGPYSNVGPELKERWLDRVTEAKGIIERYPANKPHWIMQGIYLLLMLMVAATVIVKEVKARPELAILGFVVLIGISGAFYQTRILRTGIYSVIPFCVIFAGIAWNWIEQKFATKKTLAYVAQGLTCLIMTSAFWVTMGLAGSSFTKAEVGLVKSDTAQKLESDKHADKDIECTSDLSFGDLQNLGSKHVISGLNTSTAVLVHTPHSVEAGSYHRNGESILNVVSFFQGTIDQAKQVADDRNADFVVICQKNIPPTVKDNKLTIATAIGTNKLPQWLEWVSKPDAPLAVLRVVR